MTDTGPSIGVTNGDDASKTGAFETGVIEWLIRGAFIFVGASAFAAIYAIRRLSVPLADVAYQHRLPYFQFPITLFPHWVEPVTLQPEALFHLKLTVLIPAVMIWLTVIVVIAIASGAIWLWASDTIGEGQLFDGSRNTWWQLGCLSLFAIVVVAVTAGTALLSRHPALWIVRTLLLAVVFARVFVAPVAIVLDGRGPIEAIRWSNRAVGDAGGTVTVAVLVSLLAFVRYLATVPVSLLGGKIVLAVTVIIGTALVGTLHALAMLYIYERVKAPQADIAIR